MSTINYQILTPGDDNISVESLNADDIAFDGNAGHDVLSFNSVSNFTIRNTGFSVKQKNGKWIEFLATQGDNGGSSNSVTLDAISKALAGGNGEFKYGYVLSDGQDEYNYGLYYKNFEEVKVSGSENNDVIVYQNGNYYHGKEGIDTFYADFSNQNISMQMIGTNGKAWSQPMVFNPSDSIMTSERNIEVSIESMERLLLRLGDGINFIDNRSVNTDNEIYGGKQSVHLIMGGGRDILYGGQGSDILDGGDGNDVLDGGRGQDFLLGSAGDDMLNGGDGHDILVGGTGMDVIRGGTGNDIFVVLDNHDKIEEYLHEGNDTVISLYSYDLRQAPNVENAVLFFPSNETELLNSDYDWSTLFVMERLRRDLSENITLDVQQMSSAGLQGNQLDNQLTGNFGNNVILAHQGNDILYGNGGDDLLDGGEGVDTMYGGTGNDRYYVDNAGDKVIEYADEGTDWVYSSVNFDLRQAANVEHAGLTGQGNLSLSGSNGSNHLIGNDGNNHIMGNYGNDVLDGGKGNRGAFF